MENIAIGKKTENKNIGLSDVG